MIGFGASRFKRKDPFPDAREGDREDAEGAAYGLGLFFR